MLGSPIDEIKSRLNVTDVVGQYLKLQKAGINYRSVCPFHSEKKPSFFVSPSRQIWHCFGCSAGGNIFDFVMKIEGVEFRDALRILAQKAGVELKRQDPKIQTERQRLQEVCELAAKFFERQLQESKTGQEAREYLKRRGLTDESIINWRIGYAPDNWTALSDFLVGQGYSREEAVKAGVAIKKITDNPQLTTDNRQLTTGNYFDRFRSRIMFPVCDFQGGVIGFGGRVFKKDDPAKYVNTPSTLLYDKSRVLYGLDKAKVDIRKEDNCILVEGYTDAIMVFQAGHKNVVATSGTALTFHQLRILKRYSENLYTAFDMDVAGDTATKRGIDLAQQEGFNLRVIMMPEAKDPADIVAEDPTAFGKLLEESRSIMDFYFESSFSKYDFSSPEGKRQIAKVLLPVIARIPNAIERAHWRQKLACGLGVPEEDVEQELKKVPAADLHGEYQELSQWDEPSGKRENSPPSPNGPKGVSRAKASLPPKSRKEILEEYIVSILLKWRNKVNLVEDRVLSLFSESMRQLIMELKTGNGAVFAVSVNETDRNDLSSRFRYLLLRAESEEEEDEVQVQQELTRALEELEDLDKRKQMRDLTLRLREAERNRDESRVRDLLGQFNSMIKKS